MAVKLTANYSKRLGLPGYSSHQFSVSVETEVLNVEDVQGESSRLYELLQGAVDHEIQSTGFVPPETYGMNGNGQSPAEAGNGHWACSDKQRDLLLKITGEQHLEKQAVEDLARDRFGKGVKQLSKLTMSGLLDELIENGNGGPGGRTHSNGNGRRTAYSRQGGRR